MLLSLLTLSLLAATQQTTLKINMSNMSFQVKGIYSNPQKNKNASVMEIDARNQTINNLRPILLGEECGNVVKFSEDWRSSFRSEGSDFYPNGYLELKLIAPIKKVFDYQGKIEQSTFKTQNSQPIAFRIPAYLNQDQFECGLLKIKIGSETYQAYPTTAGATAGGQVVIDLVAKGKVFVPKNEIDEKMLLDQKEHHKALLHSADSSL